MTGRSRIVLEPGTCFAVPLGSRHHVVGVIARAVAGEVLAYFFTEPRVRVPDVGSVRVRPDEASRVLRVSDLALQDGQWPIIGRLPAWAPEDWPMPHFVRREPGPRGRSFLVVRADRDGSEVLSESLVDEFVDLEPDALYGSKAAEIELRLRPARLRRVSR